MNDDDRRTLGAKRAPFKHLCDLRNSDGHFAFDMPLPHV
jgi:hypothetical protein